ncbi:MAG: ABC transporter permease [Proteobacteria bacterium]|nr:ABC transporter permease [Pseudomonadota bacterium]
MSALFRIAWRNLLRGWRRSAVVLASIVVGLTACFGILAWTVGLGHNGIDLAVRTHLAHLAIHARGYHADSSTDRRIPGDGAAVLSAVEREGLGAAAPRLVGDGLVQTARRNLSAVIVGVDAARESRVSSVPDSLVEGAYLDAAAHRWASRLPPIVVGEEMARRLGAEVGDKLVLRVPGDAGAGAFRVRGIYRSGSSAFDRSFVYVTLADAQTLFALGNAVTEIALLLSDAADAPQVQKRLRGLLAAEPPLEVLRWDERQPRLAQMIELMDQFSWVFYAVVFAAMAFGIANALLMSVYERIREFGLLRSMGLRGSRILLLVLVESFLLTGLGTGIGLGLAVPLVAWLGEVGIGMGWFSQALGEYGFSDRIYPELRPGDFPEPIGMAAATALLAGLWPALRAARLRPAEALRHV